MKDKYDLAIENSLLKTKYNKLKKMSYLFTRKLIKILGVFLLIVLLFDIVWNLASISDNAALIWNQNASIKEYKQYVDMLNVFMFVLFLLIVPLMIVIIILIFVRKKNYLCAYCRRIKIEYKIPFTKKKVTKWFPIEDFFSDFDHVICGDCSHNGISLGSIEKDKKKIERLGDVLIGKSYIKQDQLDEALSELKIIKQEKE